MAQNRNSSEHRGGLLPWPDGFGSTRPRGVLVGGTVLFGLAAVLFLGTGLSGIREHRWPTAIYGIACAYGALVFTVSSGYYLRSRRTRLPRGIRHDTVGGVAATTIPTTKVAVAAFLSFSAACIAVAAGWLLRLCADGLGARAVLSIPTAVVMVAVLAGGIWLAAIGLPTSRKPKYLRLTPEGLDFRNGFVHQRLPWNSIAAVQATTTNGNPSIQVVPNDRSALQVERTSRITQRTNLDRIALPPSAYGIDPALLLYTVDFYARHPELRTELASDAAVKRMRRGEVRG